MLIKLNSAVVMLSCVSIMNAMSGFENLSPEIVHHILWQSPTSTNAITSIKSLALVSKTMASKIPDLKEDREYISGQLNVPTALVDFLTHTKHANNHFNKYMSLVNGKQQKEMAKLCFESIPELAGAMKTWYLLQELEKLIKDYGDFIHMTRKPHWLFKPGDEWSSYA